MSRRLPTAFNGPGQTSGKLGGSNVPFFSRLGVKHGLAIVIIVAIAMAVLTVHQLRDSTEELRRAAIKKGEGVAGVSAPLLVSKIKETEGDWIQNYLTQIAEGDPEIDYIQIVDYSGKVLHGSTTRPGTTLKARWLMGLPDKERLDARPASLPWGRDQAGADIFAAILEDPRSATREQICHAPHLRVGVNLTSVLESENPLLLRKLALVTLFVTAALVAGLIGLLSFLLRPLNDLRVGLRAVAGGELDYSIPVRTNDEIGCVIRSFNATVARLRSAFDQIEALATHDALTGLPNRRAFDARLASEAARSRRYGHPFGLIVLDLDHFKVVNDTYGHRAGDAVLKMVAQAIEKNVREVDVPARIGGEEFAVILPESDLCDILAVAEKLRASVALSSCEIKHVSCPLRVTISAGVACVRGTGADAEAMLAAADSALYDSKHAGRDRVTAAVEAVLAQG